MGEFFYYKKYSLADENPLLSAVQTSGSKVNDDFIEIYNPSCNNIDISGWKIRKRTSTGTESSIKVISDNTTILAKGYFLWSNSDFSETINADQSSSSFLSDNYSIALINNDVLIDSITWGSNTNPFSGSYLHLENLLKSQTLKKDTGNTFSTELNYLPKNSSFVDNAELALCPKESPVLDPEPVIFSDKIQITELLPNPDSTASEYIELYNNSDEKIALENWSLHDASKSGEYLFSSKDEIGAKEYLALYKETFKFALNNSGNEKITLYNPDKKSVFEVEYKGSKKGLSYNFNGTDWHWSQFLTPSKENIFEKIPVGKLRVDKAVYKDVYANFEITGLSKKAKIKWNFGDDHGSSLAKTRHKYLKTGTYSASVKYSEGSEDVVKNFEIVVKKIKHPEVKIIAVNANPSGNDTDNETITLQNKSKNKIDLLGWSIATGWKKLTNHPITESFEIKKNQEREITREFSKFTLNNKKTEIELRYPDGEVADSLKYNKKKSSITEGEIYQKAKGKKWEWIIQKNNKTPEVQSQTKKIISDETDEPEKIETSIEASIREEDFQPKEGSDDFTGKFSQRESSRQDIEAKILGFRDLKSSSGFTRKFASLDQGFVLGISISKDNRLATKENSPLNKYLHKINQHLNQFILKLQK